MALFSSSYIKTTSATVQRVRDQLSFTYSAAPQAMTIYLRCISLGDDSTDAYVLHIGDSTTYIQIRTFAGIYTVTYSNGISGSKNANTGAGLTFGAFLELMVTLTSAGIAQIYQSTSGAAITSAGPTAALVLPSSWGAQTLWLNSLSTTNVGFIAIRDVNVVRGVQTMDRMRQYAGT